MKLSRAYPGLPNYWSGIVNQQVVNELSRVKADGTVCRAGDLLDVFRYRDLGISLKCSDGRVS